MSSGRAGTRPARATGRSRASRHSDPCRWSRRAREAYIVPDERRARHAYLRDVLAGLCRLQRTGSVLASLVNADAVAPVQHLSRRCVGPHDSRRKTLQRACSRTRPIGSRGVVKKLPMPGPRLHFCHSMSYLHCPACSRAFNLAVHASCPSCPVAAVPVDPVEDVVAAAESLARALAQASPAQRAAAAARLRPPGTHGENQLAAPPVDAAPVDHAGALRSIGSALMPAPRPLPRRQPLLATLALAMLDRVAPHAPSRLFRAVHARVKALAA